MTRIFITALLLLTITGPAGSVYAADKDGDYIVTGGVVHCRDYLREYGNSKLTGDQGFTANHGGFRAYGWIEGYTSAYNRFVENGKKDITATISPNSIRSWLASWCRDNPSDNMGEGIKILFDKL